MNCSRCGSQRVLHLITQPYSDGSDEGRLLVYCAVCMQDYAHRITKISTLSDMNSRRLLQIYLNGITSSDPETVSEIVFGRVNEDFVSAASQILSKRKQ